MIGICEIVYIEITRTIQHSCLGRLHLIKQCCPFMVDDYLSFGAADSLKGKQVHFRKIFATSDWQRFVLLGGMFVTRFKVITDLCCVCPLI
jgi:hypothetical protein